MAPEQPAVQVAEIALEESLTVEEVEGIAREFIQVWSVGHLDLLDRLASEDLTVSYSHFAERLEGRAAFRKTLEETFTYFPDLETTADAVVAQGDHAAVEWHYEGTHTGGDLFGVPASGRQIRVKGMTLYRIAKGKVVEERGVADVLGLMGQLGALG